MFGIQGGYLGNTAGMASVRGMSVPGELTGINPMTESYPQFMGNTTGPLAAGLGAMPPRMVAGSPSFEINESPKNRKMRGIRNRQEQGAPGEREAAEELMRRMGGPQLPLASMGGMPGAAGNIGGMMAQLPGGEQGPAQGPNTPVRNYPGMGYGPYGPGGGGLPPTPMRQATGFDRKFVS